MIPTIRRFGVSLALFLAVLAAGCTDTENPVSAVPAGPSLSSSDMSPLAKFRDKPQITIAWAKKWIGPEGGRLDFLGFAIEVPPGAVDKVTMFTIKLPVEPHAAERVIAEFGPHNKQFNVPVAIELPFSGTTIDSSTAPKIVWWNNAWIDVGGTLTADGTRLRTLTDHFSTYGTTDARGGGIYTSGG